MASLALLALAASSVAAAPFDLTSDASLARRDSLNDTSSDASGYDYYTQLYSSYGAKDVKNTCVVAHSEGQDDTPNLLAAVEYCGSKDVEIKFAEGIDYNIWSPFELANLTNVLVTLDGNLHFSQNRTLIQEQVKNITGYATYGKAGSLSPSARNITC